MVSGFENLCGANPTQNHVKKIKVIRGQFIKANIFSG